MTPAEYAETIVLPTVEEYMRQPADRLLAYLACITAAHLLDHVARATRIRPKEHAGPSRDAVFPYAPGYEQRRHAFEFDAEGRGLDQGLWDLAGFTVSHRNATYFVDDCVRATIWAFVRQYPELFATVDLAVTKPELDRWGQPV